MFSGTVNMFFSFCFFSMMGWMLEVFYRSFRNKCFTNPGFLKGPYLPVYGTAGIMLMIAIPLVQEYNIFVKAICYFLITTTSEFIAGFITQYFFNSRLWNYSDRRFQYRGHICLEFSIYWMVLAFVLEYIFMPPYQGIINWLTFGVKGSFVGIVFLSIFFTEWDKITKKRKMQWMMNFWK